MWDITVKIVRGVTLHPQSLFTVKSLLKKFQIFYPQKIKIANTKIMKICNKTKIRVLDMNLGSEISYDTSYRSLEKFQNEAA